MAEEPQPIVRVSLESGTVLAAVTGAAGALNTALAGFLLGDPFRAGDGDVRGELTRVRNAGVAAITAAAVASDSDEVLELDLVAEAALKTVDDTLWLVLRCLDGVRGLGSFAEGDVERLREVVEKIAELLPRAVPRG